MLVDDEFLEIDFKILMGFIISTISCNENIRSIYSSFKAYRSNGQFVFDASRVERIQLKFHDDYIVAHVQGLNASPRYQLATKTFARGPRQRLRIYLGVTLRSTLKKFY